MCDETELARFLDEVDRQEDVIVDLIKTEIEIAQAVQTQVEKSDSINTEVAMTDVLPKVDDAVGWLWDWWKTENRERRQQ